MTEAEWLACEEPRLMLEFLRGKAGDRKLRLFACECVRRDCWIPARFHEDRVIAVAEQMADEVATRVDIGLAHTLSQRAEAVESNGWSYLAAAVTATLTEDAIEAAVSAIDNMEGFTLELFNKFDAAGCAKLLRDIFGNPFRPVAFDPAWRTPTVLTLASVAHMVAARDNPDVHDGTRLRAAQAICDLALRVADATDRDVRLRVLELFISELRGKGDERD